MRIKTKPVLSRKYDYLLRSVAESTLFIKEGTTIGNPIKGRNPEQLPGFLKRLKKDPL
jgi:hypothetical protein